MAARRLIARWWPLVTAPTASLIVQKTMFENRWDVSGHAGEHLASATALFLAAPAVVVLLWVTPEARRQVDVLAACAAWVTATIAVMIGNVRVVDDLVAAGLGHAPTQGLPDVADHGLANTAPWMGLAAAIVLAAVMWFRRHLTSRTAIGAVLACLVVPPWIIPGAGVVIVVIARLVDNWHLDPNRSSRPERQRSQQPARRSEPQ